MSRLPRSFHFLLLVSLSPLHSAVAQQEVNHPDSLRSLAPKVYLDCRRCNEDYIRREITFVNFVRDRKAAQVHILVTSQATGGRGREFTLTFIGRENFAHKKDTLRFVSRAEATEDAVRAGIARTLKLGLVGYVARTPLADQLTVSFEQHLDPTAVVDKWDSWVFRTNLNSFFSGQRNSNFANLNGGLSANRLTPDLKIRLRLGGRYRERHITLEDHTLLPDSTTIDSTISTYVRSANFRGLWVKSLSEHWSVGASLEANSSTFSNIARELILAPAIEYNFYPYSQSTRRELRVLYTVGANPVQYNEETIYDRTSETLYGESLEVELEMTEPWGSVEISLKGSHYFHDLGKNRLELYVNTDLNLFKGLSLRLNGGYSRINDQLSLPRGGLSDEEILLGIGERATQYEYWGSLGFSYTFGSVYSNVVNSRFGN